MPHHLQIRVHLATMKPLNNNVQPDSSVHGNEEQDNTIIPQPISDNTMTAVPERGSNDTVTDATMIEINVEDTYLNHV